MANYFNIYSSSHDARGVWAADLVDNVRDPLQTLGIQTLRNGITASSFLATACSLIAVQGILPTLLDQQRIDRLDRIAAADPIQRGPGCFDATTKLAIGEVVILFSFLAFAQSIRMMNHLGFYTKVVPSKRNKHRRFHEGEAIAMSLRAATTFTLGFRSFYAFIPLLMWLFGPTALLCSTVLEVETLFFTDTMERKKLVDYGDKTEAATVVAGNGAAQSSNLTADVEMGMAHNGAAMQNNSGSKGVGTRNKGASHSEIGSD
ncbi:g4463 [Coccomyxa elongata]